MSLQMEVSQDQIERMYNNMDVDGSGEIDYTEFLSATLSAQKHSNASILNAFTTLDADGDGFITKEDISESLDGQMSEGQACHVPIADPYRPAPSNAAASARQQCSMALTRTPLPCTRAPQRRSPRCSSMPTRRGRSPSKPSSASYSLVSRPQVPTPLQASSRRS